MFNSHHLCSSLYISSEQGDLSSFWRTRSWLEPWNASLKSITNTVTHSVVICILVLYWPISLLSISQFNQINDCSSSRSFLYEAWSLYFLVSCLCCLQYFMCPGIIFSVTFVNVGTIDGSVVFAFLFRAIFVLAILMLATLMYASVVSSDKKLIYLLIYATLAYFYNTGNWG